MYSDLKYKRLLVFFKRYRFHIIPMVFHKVSLLLTFLRLKWRVFFLRMLSRGKVSNIVEIRNGFTFTRGGKISVGNNCYIGERVNFEISIEPEGVLTIGDNVWISHDCHITSWGSISIGNNVLIGEFTSIRDTTHNYKEPEIPIRMQGEKIGKIVIEDDVWIGRGCLILGNPEGLKIGKGAVIGANSVVTKSVEAYTVVGGVPAKLIKRRGE